MLHRDRDVVRCRFLILLQAWSIFFFFFQAEDGIRDLTVTGVQTCALPICTTNPARNTATVLPARLVAEGELLEASGRSTERPASPFPSIRILDEEALFEIGRASCRERV